MHGIFLNYLDGLTATLRSEAELSDPSGENLVVHFLAKEGKNGPKMTIFKIYEKLTTKFTFLTYIYIPQLLTITPIISSINYPSFSFTHYNINNSSNSIYIYIYIYI